MPKLDKRKIAQEQVLESADDFLAAGVRFEEAAGKWRAGDATKSLRFFTRAIATYEQGMHKFPRNLDLVYNKARVQLEVTTHPVLIRRLEVPLLQGLQQALSSHQDALKIDPDDADSLFNTAQVLTALAEELAKGSDESMPEAHKALEEALELQVKCLSIQEIKFEESQQQQQQQTLEPDRPPETETSPSDEDGDIKTAEEQWFSVVEPVTLDTLIETALAELATLTTLCSILSSSTLPPASPSLPWVEEFSTALLNAKLSIYSQTSDSIRLQEIALAKANFLSAFLEASFHQGAIDAEVYKQERDNAFQTPELVLAEYPEGILANAESLMAFASILGDHAEASPNQNGPARWHALSTAVINLASASKIQAIGGETLTKTHLLRGECSLLLWQLSHPPLNFQSALNHGGQLLKNAEVFFRNASKLTKNQDERENANLRSLVAESLQKGNSEDAVAGFSGHAKGSQWVSEQITDMMDDGLIPVNFLQSINHST